MNLLRRLPRELGLTYLFAAHDLAAVEQTSDRVAAMYLGRIVEAGPAARIYQQPAHPHTVALLPAVPVADPQVERHRRRIVLASDIPDPVDAPGGCCSRARCPQT